MDFNSEKNQEIKGKLVDREVFCNMSVIVEELLNAHDLDPELGFDYFDSVEPYYTFEGEELSAEEGEEIEDPEGGWESIGLQLDEVDEETYMYE